ncbi:hypothetical protein CASFOL_026174 [Castilleja foliolosa]|uniref:Protein FAR1-RELATED SEQUENCE n=1 Tax=Castilleja foliolosa TaxID=1961234 RepID=A0ABD3CJT7_9LAMI
MLRLYEGWIEILKIQKFRRLAMMEFEEGELGDLEFGEKSPEIGVSVWPLIKSFGTSCKMVHYEDGVTLYNIVHDDGVTAYDVVFSSSVNTLITCSCKMFEECGLLCRHCLRIFHMHSVQKIPDCYIKRRWTKFAKEALSDRREYWFLDCEVLVFIFRSIGFFQCVGF